MGINFAQDWPMYLLLGGFIIFVIVAIRNSRQQEKKNQAAKNKGNDKPKV